MVWGSTSSSGGASCYDDELETARSKPLKRRGLSKHYDAKCRSFSSFDVILHQDLGSAHLLAKQGSMALAAACNSPFSFSRASSSSLGGADSAPTHRLADSDRMEEDLCAELLGSLHIVRRPSHIKISRLHPVSTCLGQQQQQQQGQVAHLGLPLAVALPDVMEQQASTLAMYQ